jgi:hypothetical protein
MVEHQPLPVTRPLRNVAARPRALERFGVGRKVFIRFAHSQRRGHLGPQVRDRPPALLVECSEGDQRGRDDAHAPWEREVSAPAGQFLLMDVPLQDRRVPPPEADELCAKRP